MREKDLQGCQIRCDVKSIIKKYFFQVQSNHRFQKKIEGAHVLDYKWSFFFPRRRPTRKVSQDRADAVILLNSSTQTRRRAGSRCPGGSTFLPLQFTRGLAPHLKRETALKAYSRSTVFPLAIGSAGSLAKFGRLTRRKETFWRDSLEASSPKEGPKRAIRSSEWRQITNSIIFMRQVKNVPIPAVFFF